MFSALSQDFVKAEVAYRQERLVRNASARGWAALVRRPRRAAALSRPVIARPVGVRLAAHH